MKKFLVSTADVYGYDQNDNELFRGVTMLDTSIETSLSNTDVRGGQGNKLLYIYYHTAEMNITINNAEFSLDFLALNVGSNIKVGADMFIDETVTVTGGTGLVTKTPLTLNTSTAYGWVTMPDKSVEKVAFTSGSTFTLSGANASFSGDVCVRYYANQITARDVTVYADMMPSNIRLVMEAILASSDAVTNRIGKVQVHVPRASMTGAFTLSMTPDSVASTPLNVRALAYEKAAVSGGCDGSRPIYAEIIEIIDNTNWYDGVVALAIEGGDFSLEAGDAKTLKVYAMRADGSAPFLAPTSGLTFSSETTAAATVSSAGLVTAVAEGTSNVTVVITELESINANVVVTVTA